MKEFINEHGLLNPREHDIVSENTFLCTVEYLLRVKEKYGAALDLYFYDGNVVGEMFLHGRLRYSMEAYLALCTESYKKKFIYHNVPMQIMTGPDLYTSPDQLIAYSVYSKRAAKDITKWLFTHWLTYDNLSKKTNFKRLMQPLAVLTALYKAGFTFIYPALFLVLFVSIFFGDNGQTSGRLKAWTVMRGLKLYKTYRFMTKFIDKKYSSGWKTVFWIYYPFNHPINLIK